MNKKYIVTGKSKTFGKEVKFFIFGDSAEAGDFVIITNLDIYVFVDEKLQTNDRLQQMKDRCFMINKITKKGRMYKPNTPEAENIEVKIEETNNYYNITETDRDISEFMKELA